MSPKEIIKGIWRMCSVFPYWDVSYLVAIAFTIGSITWCFNGFFAWLPLQDPGSEFPTEALYGAGITAFIGATIFEIGSVLLMVEAVNEDRSDCFGWALEGAVEEGGLARLHPGRCSHHHRNRHNFVGKGETAQSEIPLDEPGISKSHPHPSSARSWTWWPTWYELRTRYMRDIGFLASLSQFIGASIFWISGFTALPGINNNLSPAALDGAFWAPQVVGGTGFIVSGTLFMLETQKKWYTPALGVLGWHVGFWNLIGAIGFTLCGALGFSSGSGELYQSSLATFWGSWAFLIGSLLQWYESLDKYPVVIEAVSGFSSSSASTSEQDGGKK
ncbi:MAG: hypothetical protein M1818_004440 [Claussenomyces sp. TS43310]|nr:MAG: hypothetical protein M1818_004440 [Claussenomyces sp. TS43310]